MRHMAAKEDFEMSERRHCKLCGQVVECREERTAIAGSHLWRVSLSCPRCGRRIADLYTGEAET
jgi:ribosome-binding protein aMBF1 (putative translation factor)